MFREKLNGTEIRIMRLFPRSSISVAGIAEALEINFSWAYKCISHLEEMGFLNSGKNKRSTFVKMSDTPLGNALSVLLVEEPAMNLDALLGVSSLRMLPLLPEPGYSIGEMTERTGLSPRTVQTRIKKWRSMGVVIYLNRKYMLSPRHPLVINLVREYSRSRNMLHLRESPFNATIVWQDRDEYLISTDKRVADGRYPKAGPTLLAELGYDIVSRNFYYMFNPLAIPVSEAESLVQTVMLDPINPRPLEYIGQAVSGNRVSKTEIKYYSAKYGVKDRVEEVL